MEDSIVRRKYHALIYELFFFIQYQIGALKFLMLPVEFVKLELLLIGKS